MNWPSLKKILFVKKVKQIFVTPCTNHPPSIWNCVKQKRALQKDQNTYSKLQLTRVDILDWWQPSRIFICSSLDTRCFWLLYTFSVSANGQLQITTYFGSFLAPANGPKSHTYFVSFLLVSFRGSPSNLLLIVAKHHPEVDICSRLGWSEIKLLLKSQNYQVYYGSIIIPEQLLADSFGHRVYQF